jgi:hypothetical protein
VRMVVFWAIRGVTLRSRRSSNDPCRSSPCGCPASGGALGARLARGQSKSDRGHILLTIQANLRRLCNFGGLVQPRPAGEGGSPLRNRPSATRVSRVPPKRLAHPRRLSAHLRLLINLAATSTPDCRPALQSCDVL